MQVGGRRGGALRRACFGAGVRWAAPPCLPLASAAQTTLACAAAATCLCRRRFLLWLRPEQGAGPAGTRGTHQQHRGEGRRGRVRASALPAACASMPQPLQLLLPAACFRLDGARPGLLHACRLACRTAPWGRCWPLPTSLPTRWRRCHAPYQVGARCGGARAGLQDCYGMAAWDGSVGWQRELSSPDEHPTHAPARPPGPPSLVTLNQSININQPINHSTNQSTSTNQPINQSINQSVNQSINQHRRRHTPTSCCPPSPVFSAACMHSIMGSLLAAMWRGQPTGEEDDAAAAAAPAAM